MGFEIARYGPRDQARFRNHILPLLRDRGERYRHVTIYHYAKGVTLARQPDSRFPGNNARHFLTGQNVDVPAATEIGDGRRNAAGGSFQWNAGTENGTSATDLNTIASIQTLQEGIAARQRGYAEYRTAMYAKENVELEARGARARGATAWTSSSRAAGCSASIGWRSRTTTASSTKWRAFATLQMGSPCGQGTSQPTRAESE